MTNKIIKQTKLLSLQSFTIYKDEYEEDFSTFEQYMNVELRKLSDQNCIVEIIIPMSLTDYMIVYSMRK